jgi:exodeoxyribonuclease V beta subunit
VSFDLCGELPRGTTVLEASAGTGKTYTIAGLAARYVAAGVPLDRLLLVTFTRMATGELRERVRERLNEVLRGLEGEPSEDPVVALLARGDVEAHRRHLARAVADFDAATIVTTHAFCQEMLGSLGIAGDLEPDATFVEDIRDLRAEVVDDLFVRRFADRPGEDVPVRLAEARRIAEVAVDNPVTPLAAAPAGPAAVRHGIAKFTREELERRKRRLGLVTYDDLLTRLRAVLADDPVAVRRLRERFSHVLVDEFQDTDPVQWEILRTAFTQPSPSAAAGTGAGNVLVLIGDPKQAIYAFRGADVFAYLEAAGSTTRETLGVNYRSDQRLIDAYDALFGDARLGHEQIAYLKVRARHGTRLHGAGAPLRVRVLPRRDTTPKGHAALNPAREQVAVDCAADIVELLNGDAQIEGRDVEPGDVAVLVPTNRLAAMIRDALEQVGVPAVINGAGSVFGTEAAEEWLALLEALERPGHQMRAHAAALTCFLGWSAEEVAAAGDERWEAVHRRLHDWARVLRTRGVASLTETVSLVEGLPERVLGRRGGERRLTDLRHVAQLLHAAASAEGLGTTALAAWLRRRIDEAHSDTADEDRSRRLESDADAVQVLTIHRSKGLEFPIVHLPYAWDLGRPERRSEPVVFHDDDGVRTLDVACYGSAYQDHLQRYKLEEQGEDLRLLYVAMTRARHQCVLWWAGTWQGRDTALSRLVFAREADGTVRPFGSAPPADDEAFARFEELATGAGGCMAVEWAVPPPPPVHWQRPQPRRAELATAAFERGLDWDWRRTSYSDITALAHETARVGSEPEEDAVDDEPDEEEAAPAEGPWASVPGGMRVGTTVHRALEELDFAAPEFGPEVAELGAVEGLRQAIATPLGEPFGIRLADLSVADRLDELAFELPLAGGDTPRGEVTLDAIAAALGDELGGYAARLRDRGLRARVRGFLTGSLDLVARLPDGRYAIFDYKTNALPSFAADALAAEMHRRHYGLQALLYTVALHRYLRWRLPGYDPDRHLAGVGYLFLRGIDGTEGAGVYAWRPPADVVERVSDALDG